MSKSLRALILFGFMAACGSSNHVAPRNLNDACSIIDQRPNYLTAMKRTERRLGRAGRGADGHDLPGKQIHRQRPHPAPVRAWRDPHGPPKLGLWIRQALDGTWDEYKQEQGGWGRRRDDIADATDFMGWYFAKSQRDLGISVADARNQYLAYHEGRTGYRRGSHRNKSWLLRVSSEVEGRAIMYDTQLRSCGLI